MTRISDLHELGVKIQSCSEALEQKFSGADGKRHVLVCSGTGCLSSRSQEIFEAFVHLVETGGLANRVTVNQVGCFGLCSQGPFVKIYPEDTLYRLVTEEDVVEIVTSDLAGGQTVERLLYVDPATGQKIPARTTSPFTSDRSASPCTAAARSIPGAWTRPSGPARSRVCAAPWTSAPRRWSA